MQEMNSPSSGYCRTRETNYHRTAEERSPPPQLQVVGSQRALRLEGPRHTVGSAPDNDLVLRDPFISKCHCALDVHGGRVWIEDVGSRNGTWVNSIQVSRSEVGMGANILMGRTSLKLVGINEAANLMGMVGRHPSMQRVFTQIERFSQRAEPVLILGATGTGKELVARALHEHSSYRFGPFEPLNCGAIPSELAEAELFGHARGAFTGAAKERKGAFERANSGTLFLDEIGEMPAALQPKILRVLEEGLVQRVGGSQRRQVNVRILAATNRDLLEDAGRFRFRLDLYHRLAVGVIRLPELRQRKEDIPALVEHFLKQCAGTGPRFDIDPRALRLLERHPWPGNVRELRNAIYRATMEGGQRLRGEDFRFLEEAGAQGKPREDDYVYITGRDHLSIRREIYLKTLKRLGGNRTAAAGTLGIPKSTFFDQLRALEI